MAGKKTWGRFPEQSNEIDENTHWAVQQGWMAIFVPFVPLAAIAAVLSQVTDIDLLAKYETAQSQARQAQNQIEEICSDVGRPCAEVGRHLKTMGKFKTEAEYGQLLVAQREIEDWWPHVVSEPAKISRDERLEHVRSRLQGFVAENLKLKPRELEQQTYERIKEESATIVGDLELELWTEMLGDVDGGAILTQCDLNEKDDLSERARKAELLPRVQSHVTERIEMVNPPDDERARAQLKERVAQIFGEEITRLDQEDRTDAAWVAAFSFQEELEVCMLTNRDRAESEARLEIFESPASSLGKPECWGTHTRQAFKTAVAQRVDQQIAERDTRLSTRVNSLHDRHLGEMDMDQRADPSAFEQQVVVTLKMAVGVDQCQPGWKTVLPKTTAAVTQRAASHSSGMQAALRARLGEMIEAVNSLDEMDPARRAELVVAAANRPHDVESTEGLEEAMRSFAEVTGMDEMLLEEDWTRFHDHFLALIARESENWSGRVTRAIENASLPQTAQGVQVSDHTNRDALIRRMSEEILVEVEDSLQHQQAVAADPRLFEHARALAEKRAGEHLDKVFVVSRDTLVAYAEPLLSTRVALLSAERLVPRAQRETIDQVIRGIFPVPGDHEEAAIRNTRFTHLTEDIVADLENTAGEYVENRIDQLVAEAEQRILEIDEVEAFTPVTLATLEDWRVVTSAKQAAEREIRDEIGAYGQLEGTRQPTAERAAELFKRHRAALYDAGFAPALTAQTLRSDEYRDPCELKDVEEETGKLVSVLIDRTREMLDIKGEFTVSEDLSNQARDRARDLLEKRVGEIVEEQLSISEGNPVEVEVFSGDTIDSLLERELKAIFEGVRCVLPAVTAQIREDRRQAASQRIEKMKVLLARLDQVEDVIVKGGASLPKSTNDRPGEDTPEDATREPRESMGSTRSRSMGEIESLLASGESTILGMQERNLVAAHVDDVEIKSAWFPDWSVDDQNKLKASNGDHLNLFQYRSRVLEAAGLSDTEATALAKSEADEQARARLIAHGNKLVQEKLAEQRDVDEAKRLNRNYGPRFVNLYKKSFARGEPTLAMSRDELQKEILGQIDAKRLRPGVRKYLAGLIADEVVSEQYAQQRKIRGEISSWHRGRIEGIEGNQEDLARILKKFEDSEVTPEALQEIVKVLKDMFEGDGQPRSAIELKIFSGDLMRQARSIGYQLSGMLKEGQYVAYVDPPTRSGSTSTSNTTSTGAGPSPTTPPGNQGQGNAGTQPPGSVPVQQPPPPPPPIDLVIAIHQPTAADSRTEVTVWEYSGNSYNRSLVKKETLLLMGSPSQENYQKWASRLGIWLSGSKNNADGLAGAVDEVFKQSKIMATQMTVRIHVALSGDALPQGFSRMISKDVVPKLATRFQQRNNINSMETVTWTNWDRTTGELLNVAHGPLNLAPSNWPPTHTPPRK